MLVDGADAATLDPFELRRRTGYVPQDGGLLPHWRVRRNVALVPWLRGMRGPPSDAGRPRAASWSASSPSASARAGRASCRAGSGSGSRWRGRSPREPDVVLLDEPFGALDAITRADLQTTFLELRRELALTAAAGDPRPAEAFLLADRIAVLRGGRLEQIGPAGGAARERRPRRTCASCCGAPGSTA